MKKIIALFALVFFSLLSLTQAQVHLKGEIGVRVFESKDNPHIVDEPITITKGATVTIKKGTVFLFKNYAGLKVQGSLIVQGTKDEPVIFTSFNHRKYNPDAEMYPNAFDWNGISIEEGSGAVELHHFYLMYSVYGVKSKNEKVLINSGLFSNNGQCDVVINDKMKVVLKDEPFSYSHTKKVEPVPEEKPDEVATKEETAVVSTETQVTPPVVVAKPVVPKETEKPDVKEEENDTTKVAQETKPEVKPEEKEEPDKKPEEKAEEKEEKEEEKKPEKDESWAKKNNNVPGIRISFNWFPGEIPMQVWDGDDNKFIDVVDKDYFKDLEGKYGYSGVYYNKLHFRFNVHFMIKTGQYLTIDVGPGFMFCNRQGGYKFDDADDIYYVDYQDIDWQWVILAPNVSFGINFVKRFHPVKINAGMLADVNFNIFRYMFKGYEDGHDTSGTYYETDQNVDDYDFGINVSFGPRVGAEIQAGTHFGFSIDFLYRFYQIENEFELKETNSGTMSKVRWKFKMPGIGFGAGFNFYF